MKMTQQKPQTTPMATPQPSSRSVCCRSTKRAVQTMPLSRTVRQSQPVGSKEKMSGKILYQNLFSLNTCQDPADSLHNNFHDKDTIHSLIQAFTDIPFRARNSAISSSTVSSPSQ